MITKRLLLLVFALSAALFVTAQDVVIMPVSGHKDTTASHIIVYDDGGKDGVHSSRCDASYTFHTVNPDGKFYISVHSKLAHGNPGLASLKIIDGEDDNGFYIFNEAYDIKGVYYSTGNSVTVVFKADDDDPTDGFEISLEECSLAAPENVTWEQIDSTTIKLSWTEADTTTHWVIDYTQINFSTWNNPSVDFAYDEDYLTVYSDTNYVLLTDLQPHQWLSYNVYGKTSDGLIGCGGFSGYCPCLYPENMVITHDKDSLYFSWDEPDTSVIWSFHVWGNGFEEYHHLTENYWSYPLSCSQKLNQAYIVGNCDVYTDYFGANTWCAHTWLGVNELQLTCPNVQYVRPRAIGNHSITVMWTEIDTVDTYIVGYRQANMTEDDVILYDTFSKGTNVCTIEGLEENTSYIITVYTLCNDGGLSCGTEEWITTTFENCLDFTNLIGPKTYLTWGDYDNPQADLHMSNYRLGDESVEDGSNDWFWGSDRHVVKNDTTEMDWRTNWLLRCVPEGELASVRLGNDNINREAESISYEYTVDTLDKDMIVLKYAVVMQDPGHTRENQPRFTLEILDENNQVIDTTCCFADFYAAGDLGWNEVEGSTTKTIWKDWTTVGIDIAPYHGKTIRVRLTTYDCDEGGHFGYAYFNIKCDNKKLYIVDRCNAGDSVYLEAPLGFDYYWHKLGESDTLSKTYDILVPVDDNVYECVASFVGKPSCNFTIATVPVHVNPMADGYYKIDTCESEITFVNNSYMDFDSTLDVFTRQFVDSTYWIFEDGTVSYEDTVKRKYTDNGDYTVKLVCKLSNSLCTDTLKFPLHIDFNLPVYLKGDTVICNGDKDTLQVIVDPSYQHSLTYLWDNGQTTDKIVVSPNETTIYNVSLTTPAGCGGSLTKTVIVNPSYNDTIYDTICGGEVYTFQGNQYTKSGVYEVKYQTQFNNAGCDSIKTLILHVNPSYDTVINATIYQGEAYYYNDSTVRTYSGSFTDTLTTINGCDSIIHLNLSVVPKNPGQMQCDISIIPHDVMYINRDTVVELSLDKQATYYRWRNADNTASTADINDTTSPNPKITLHPGQRVTYIVDSYFEDENNLVFNGDFEKGNIGFESEYKYVKETSVLYEGQYAIGKSARDFHPSLFDCPNNKTDFFIANGHGTPNTRLYTTNVSVDTNVTYAVSFSVTNVSDIITALPKFQFSVNNVQLGGIFTIQSQQCDWQKYYELWNSGSDTLARISLLNQNSEMMGNDFAVDSIRFVKLCKTSDTVTLVARTYVSDTVYAAICEGQEYEFLNKTYSQTGIYTDTIVSYTSLTDTLQVLNLVVNPVYDTVIDAEICQGQTYNENGFNESEAGSYTLELQSAAGCDSVVHLNLTVYKVYNDTIFARTCDEDYSGYNFLVSETGIYYQYLTSSEGCVSTVTLAFERKPEFTDTIHAEIYIGDTFTYTNFTESETGTYIFDTVDMDGCDSTYILELKVINIVFPNAVTPNGDGVNDIFEPKDLLEQTMFEETRLTIYSRYGKVIYDKTNAHDRKDLWDPNATNTPTGTYFWRFIAKSTSKNIDIKGTVDVIR